MQDLIQKAGLTPDILKDSAKRSLAIHETNASAGGLRKLMQGGKLTLAPVHAIPSNVSRQDTVRYLRFVAAGKRIPIIFAAGRATRMKLPVMFDRLGIGGLTGHLLEALNAKESHDMLRMLVNTTSNGEGRGPQDLSFIQRVLLQYRAQHEKLFENNSQADVTFKDWISHAKFAVVANDENKSALALQLASIGFAGLKPENIFFVVQPEEGGLEVLPDGTTAPYSKEVWPEGHGKPFLDMRSDPKAAYGVNSKGHLIPLNKPFVEFLLENGVERAVFAQVNDLHLLEDMAHVERWVIADSLIQKGAEMVLEMVENGLKQKGGGIFKAPGDLVVMRDTIAMKSADLDAYSVPESLSRMFYELTVAGMAKLGVSSLPAYLNERNTTTGKTVLTREYYSGDASSALKTQAIQQKGYDLDTFKMQSRIPTALDAIQIQNDQPGFFSIFKAR